MKIVQVLYGYLLMISIVYLVAKVISLFVPLETFHFFLLISALMMIFFRVQPHSERHRYPFAFEIVSPFQHRN